MEDNNNDRLAEEILVMIKDEINRLPVNLSGEIIKTYEADYVDVKINDSIILKYIKCIGSKEIGKTGIILFLNGDDNNAIFITSGSSGGTEDLSEYVKKADVRLKFDISSPNSLNDSNGGYMTIGIDVGDGF